MKVVLARTAGFCIGVKRALEMVLEATGSPVSMYRRTIECRISAFRRDNDTSCAMLDSEEPRPLDMYSRRCDEQGSRRRPRA